MKQWIILLMTLLLMATGAHAANVTLTWEAPDDATNVVGYRLYSGSASHTYTNNTDVGLTTTYTVTNIARGVLTYFAVKAYNAQGRLSDDFSNEVSALVPLPVGSPSIHQVIVTFSTYKNAPLPAAQSQRKKSKKRL